MSVLKKVVFFGIFLSLSVVFLVWAHGEKSLFVPNDRKEPRKLFLSSVRPHNDSPLFASYSPQPLSPSTPPARPPQEMPDDARLLNNKIETLPLQPFHASSSVDARTKGNLGERKGGDRTLDPNHLVPRVDAGHRLQIPGDKDENEMKTATMLDRTPAAPKGILPGQADDIQPGGASIKEEHRNIIEQWTGLGTVLSVTSGNQEVIITWDAAHRGNGFSVYYGTSPSMGPDKGEEKRCPTPPCVLTGLANGTIYYFAIAETDLSGKQGVIIATASAIPMNPSGHTADWRTSDAPAMRPGCAMPCLGAPVVDITGASSSRGIADCTDTNRCGEVVSSPRIFAGDPSAISDVTIVPRLDPTCDREGCIASQGIASVAPAATQQVPIQFDKGLLIETKGSPHLSARKVAFSSSGNGMTVWQQMDRGRQTIWASRLIGRQGWQKGIPISTNDSDAFFPEVAVDSSGNAMAVWFQHDGSQRNIWANRFTPKSGWGKSQLLETGDGEALFPQMAIDPKGNAMAVWFQHDGLRYNIWANRFLLESGWEEATRIETENLGGAFSPRVALDPSGNAVVVWYQSDGKQYHIWANRFSGSHWKTAVRVAEGNPSLSEAPQIIVDPLGNAIVAWRQDNNRRPSTWANWFVAGLGWGTAQPLETNNSDWASSQ